MIESHSGVVKKAMIVRVKKEDSAYLYRLLESYEGLTNFSTVTSGKGDTFRDIELQYSPEMKAQLLIQLEHIAKEIYLELLSTK